MSKSKGKFSLRGKAPETISTSLEVLNSNTNFTGLVIKIELLFHLALSFSSVVREAKGAISKERTSILAVLGQNSLDKLRGVSMALALNAFDFFSLHVPSFSSVQT